MTPKNSKLEIHSEIKYSNLDSSKTDFSDEKNSGIKSIHEFIQKISEISQDCFDEKNDKIIFYRGQSNKSWKLRPSLFQDEDTIQKEKRIIRDLITRQANDFSNDKTMLDYLVRAQHFGLPTRLLDVTRAPLIALYFSCSDENEIGENGKVFILKIKEKDLKSFESDSVTLRANLARLSLKEKENLSKNTKPILQAVRRDNPVFQEEVLVKNLQKPVFLLPKQNNDRIIAQQGIFLLFGLNKTELDDTNIAHQNFEIQSIEINSKAKGQILKDLEILGIHKSTVFPDLEHCAEYLKESLKRLELDAKRGMPDAQYKLGMQYFLGFGRIKNGKKACNWLKKAADQGVAEALCELGLRCINTQDFEKAFQHYTKADKEHNSARAQFNLGVMYYKGEYVEQSFEKAFDRWKQAASQNYANAEYNIGLMYYKGEGTQQDFKEARKWFEKAANQGQPDAQCYLGLMYIYAHGVNQNFEEAFKYFKKAADQGNAEGEYNLGVMYYRGEGIPKNIKEALKYCEKAAEKGYARAQFSIGINYYDGNGVKQDLKKALEYWEKAANQEFAPAQFYTGLMYHEGEGVKKDLIEAFKYFKKAADHEIAPAQWHIGLMYYEGEGVEKDLIEAFKYFKKAAEQELPEAQFTISLMYYEGEGVKKDLTEAFKYFKKAADNEIAQAQWHIGLMYYKGEGVKKDSAEALKWIKKAAEQGNENAIKFLKNKK